MACPAVAGLAALVASMNSTRSGMEIKQLIMDNVQVKDKYADIVSTSGLIDVEKTIKAATAKDCSGSCYLDYWKGDNYCDDENNNCGCEWDGGDCCGEEVDTNYCQECECLDPSQQATTTPASCTDTCGDQNRKGNGECDDENNNCGCEWDGGDCCGWLVICTGHEKCDCLDPSKA